ncbi:hypothetical protein FA13DRAFT_643455 [Coprinellus micaceus]|uniref:HMG box domain-containing protein n=1 Tax=Coprinellus micaceus TaxID=71717 RepID=A0A4Y7T5N8_COPMI|nr:hypothetical protein FA13DRAFT_643455 [Coprinellus micaceus]
MPTENTCTESDGSLAWPEYSDVEFKKATDSDGKPSQLVATFIPAEDCFDHVTFTIRPPVSDKTLSDDELSKRPPNPFFIFAGANRRPLMEVVNNMYKPAGDPDDETVKSGKGRLPVMLSSRLLSLAWHGLSDSQREPYHDEAERRKKLHFEAWQSGRVVRKKPRARVTRSEKERPKETTARPRSSAAKDRVPKKEERAEDDKVPPAAAPTTPSLRSAQPTPQALQAMTEAYRRNLPPRSLAQLDSAVRQRYEGQAPALAARVRGNRESLGRQSLMPTLFPVGHYAASSISMSSRTSSLRGLASLSRSSTLQSEQDFDAPQGRFEFNPQGVYATSTQHTPAMPTNNGMRTVNQGMVTNEYTVTRRPSYQLPEPFDPNRAGPSTSRNGGSMYRNGAGHGRARPAPLARTGSADTGYCSSDAGCSSDWSGPDMHREWVDSDPDMSWLSGSEGD